MWKRSGVIILNRNWSCRRLFWIRIQDSSWLDSPAMLPTRIYSANWKRCFLFPHPRLRAGDILYMWWWCISIRKLYHPLFNYTTWLGEADLTLARSGKPRLKKATARFNIWKLPDWPLSSHYDVTSLSGRQLNHVTSSLQKIGNQLLYP